MTPHPTPGPWSWECHPDTRKPIALAAGPADVLLATGDGAGRCWVEVSDADARLIEAAPDGYRLAGLILSLAGHGMEFPALLTAAARDLAAKAKGGAPCP